MISRCCWSFQMQQAEKEVASIKQTLASQYDGLIAKCTRRTQAAHELALRQVRPTPKAAVGHEATSGRLSAGLLARCIRALVVCRPLR